MVVEPGNRLGRLARITSICFLYLTVPSRSLFHRQACLPQSPSRPSQQLGCSHAPYVSSAVSNVAAHFLARTASGQACNVSNRPSTNAAAASRSGDCWTAFITTKIFFDRTTFRLSLCTARLLLLRLFVTSTTMRIPLGGTKTRKPCTCMTASVRDAAEELELQANPSSHRDVWQSMKRVVYLPLDVIRASLD